MVLISRLPRWIAGTSVPWRNRLEAGWICTLNWPGALFSSCSLNTFKPPTSQSLSAPADEMRSCTWALADIETHASTARTIAFTGPPLVWSGGLDLRDCHRQPLYPLMAEVDLYTSTAAV